MKLPEIFYNRMKNLLKNEINEFLSIYDRCSYKGIRVNTLKINKKDFEKKFPFIIEPIKWTKEGYYLFEENNKRPGKHPYYHCGLFYMQEPSAMLPVEALDPQPGEKILDICAAPGGKTTQIGARMKNEGILIANDINPKRTSALIKNVEMFGIRNCMVTNERPEKLAQIFKGYFDKILIDAPCSGEGTFRKDPKSIQNYNLYNVEQCKNMQKNILQYIPSMLKPGGKIVYSTCTFSPEENEGTIQWFINKYPQFKISDIEISELDNGKPEWINGDIELKKTKRAWPHKIKGEGHFIAKIEKKDGQEEKQTFFKSNSLNLEPYYDFVKEYSIPKLYTNNIHNKKGKLFLVPKELVKYERLKSLNIGLNIGEIKNNRFIPSQALALSLNINNFTNILNLSSDDINTKKYLKGETIMVKGSRGWRLVCIDGYSVGWGKQIENMLKNHYKNEWRML